MNRNDWTKICAFWGIVIATTLLIVNAIIHWAGGNLGLVGAIFDLLAKIALLLAVAFPAYSYVAHRKVGWKITYWVALVIYVVFIVLPVFI